MVRVPLARIPAHPIKWAVFTDGAARVLVDCWHVRQLLKLKKNKVTLELDEHGLHCRWSATGVYNANANKYGEWLCHAEADDALAKYVKRKYLPRKVEDVKAQLRAEVMAQAVEVLLT